MKRGLILYFAVLLAGSAGYAGGLDRLENVVLVDSPANDGDSFLIRYGRTERVIRLYYIDCPEERATTSADQRRMREQTRWFGLPSDRHTIQYGREAAAFTRRQLAAPFTVYTAYADARGRTAGGRIYAFVITADGRDLAELLLENGYARAYGYRRALPDGTPWKDAAVRFEGLEAEAARQRKGVWSESRTGTPPAR